MLAAAPPRLAFKPGARHVLPELGGCPPRRFAAQRRPLLQLLGDERLRGLDALVALDQLRQRQHRRNARIVLDHFLEEYFFRPSAIVCYSAGAFGGVRAAMQLRAMLGELGMPSISSLFPIPRIQSALDADGRPLDSEMDRRFGRFGAELEWYAEALRDRRMKGVPY